MCPDAPSIDDSLLTAAILKEIVIATPDVMREDGNLVVALDRSEPLHINTHFPPRT